MAARRGEPERWFSFVGGVLRGLKMQPISALRATKPVGVIPVATWARMIAETYGGKAPKLTVRRGVGRAGDWRVCVWA